MATFKARARALDLLGRQQIAGIPTAINELFKNAHDAYADNVQVDYLRKQKLFVLRDDGLGMTRSDFETRWLTLGTESKFANSRIPPPPKHPDKPERPVMGEKGIGRLAIASIGKQVLILTHAMRVGQQHPVVVAYINWELFELPVVNLEDIPIPIREFASLPGKDEIDAMKHEVLDAIVRLVGQGDVEVDAGNRIAESIRTFAGYPSEVAPNLPGPPSLTIDRSGTHFYVYPVDDTLNQDIDSERDNKDATKIEKMLVGFTNTMTPGQPKPAIDAVFRDYRSDDGSYFNILDKDLFFTPEDFATADHRFQGSFDEYGQFSGTISVYNEKQYEHKIIWNSNNYRLTDCGPFTINVAYVQGTQRQSIIPPEEYTRLTAKADKYGGLYIYRDNIRILPYGNSDFDFIDIEKNRTKSASYYFFSFRRMFGVVDISKDNNASLKEKAGREGFIENKAYRQLRDILKNFFVQLAGDFFREGGGPKTDFWQQKRSERERIYKVIEKQEKQVKVKKDKFLTALNSFFAALTANKFQQQFDDFLIDTEKKISSVAYLTNPNEAAQRLLDLESEIRQQFETLRQRTKVSSPRGFALFRDQRKDWDIYLNEYEKLKANLFLPAENRIDEIINDYAQRLHLEVSKRKRLEQAVDFISNEAKRITDRKNKETKDVVVSITNKVRELSNELMIDLENKIRDVKDRFKLLPVEEAADFDLVIERKRMEDEILQERERSTAILESVVSQLESIYWGRDQEGHLVTNADIQEGVMEELHELRERLQTDVELSQLGLAVGVIQHEFNSTVNTIRGSIRELKAWADVNQQMEGIYNNIRINFEHLDSYLNLFTPLNRRLQRKPENIPANDILIFLLDLFRPRLERHHIQFKHTQGFKKRSLYGYRSTFYPVFVNVVDNAIHWLNQLPEATEKVIRFHADDSGFYVSNNGPAISINERERIFDLGFTKKLNGRGMGLHISREVLQSTKHQISVDEPRPGSTVTFKIHPSTARFDDE